MTVISYFRHTLGQVATASEMRDLHETAMAARLALLDTILTSWYPAPNSHSMSLPENARLYAAVGTATLGLATVSGLTNV